MMQYLNNGKTLIDLQGRLPLIDHKAGDKHI